MYEFEKILREEAQLRALSEVSYKTYFYRLRSFHNYFEKPLSEITLPEIRKYFLYLINVKKTGRESIRNTRYAIRFYYVNCLGLTEYNLDFERNCWSKSHHKFLVPVKALSKLYRMKFENILKSKAPELYNKIPKNIWREKAFVTHSQAVGKGEAAFRYLANYVYKAAISNNRIISCRNGKVTFSYKDSKTGESKLQSLDAMEFIRRFLQHTLPAGF